ncbi:MAG: hypothetical protein ABIF71_03290 [Planctomycetota bacterium]
MTQDEIFAALDIRPAEHRDLHVLRNFSAFVAVSEGRVIAMTDPWLRHCPLFDMLYERRETAILRRSGRASARRSRPRSPSSACSQRGASSSAPTSPCPTAPRK